MRLNRLKDSTLMGVQVGMHRDNSKTVITRSRDALVQSNLHSEKLQVLPMGFIVVCNFQSLQLQRFLVENFVFFG